MVVRMQQDANFWADLPKPFFCLAPLANVTDPAFRRIIAKYSKPQGLATSMKSAGGPDVMYTEFVSADGLMLAGAEGKSKLMRDLQFSEAERPIVAQFFTANPERMEKAAALALACGFDGVDINMGCPDKTIEKQGAGARLIQTPELACVLIASAKKGTKGKIPVSVKTRLGYNKDILEEWLPALLSAEPAAITLHARTRKEMSLVPARWERIKRAVEIRDERGSNTLIVGNGDLKDMDDARAKVAESGADGAMLGRAIFGRPWLFAVAESEVLKQKSGPQAAHIGGPGVPRTFVEELQTQLPVETRLGIAIEHTKLFEELLGDIKNFALMKKHFKAYVEGFPGARELRMQLMETRNAQEVEKIINDFLSISVY